MSIREALRRAEEAELDLVEVAPQSRPPVCRLMDFGKYRYEQSKKERETRKKQKVGAVKELRMSPKTDRHDFEVKLRNAERFLREGDRVKVSIRFRGREIVHAELARERLLMMSDLLAEVGVKEREPFLEGRQITMVLAPKKTVKEGPSKPAPAGEPPVEEVAVHAEG